MSHPLDICPIDPRDPDAMVLIDLSEAEQAAIYPPEVHFAFSPQELVDSGVIFLIARRDGVPVGCGGVTPLDGYGELKRIFTIPEARGTGVAAALLAALESAARAQGLPILRLETGEDSPEALAFYAKNAYSRRGPFGDYQENGASVFMEKRLG